MLRDHKEMFVKQTKKGCIQEVRFTSPQKLGNFQHCSMHGLACIALLVR